MCFLLGVHSWYLHCDYINLPTWWPKVTNHDCSSYLQPRHCTSQFIVTTKVHQNTSADLFFNNTFGKYSRNQNLNQWSVYLRLLMNFMPLLITRSNRYKWNKKSVFSEVTHLKMSVSLTKDPHVKGHLRSDHITNLPVKLGYFLFCNQNKFWFSKEVVL